MPKSTQLELMPSGDTDDNNLKAPRKVSYKLYDNSYDTIKAIENLKRFKLLAIDLETTALNPVDGRIRLVQIATDGESATIIDVDAVGGMEAIAPALTDLFHGRKKVAHNAVFECKWLEENGVGFRRPIFDTMLASQLYSCGHKFPANLEAMAARYLKESLPKDEQKADWGRAELTPAQLEYAARDAAILIPLRNELIPRLNNSGLVEVAKIEFDAVPAFATMERHGVRFDWSRLDEQIEAIGRQRETALAEFYAALDEALDEAGEPPVQRDLFGAIAINPNSPQQLQPLFEICGIPVASVDQKELALHANEYPLIGAYLNWKNLETAERDATKYTNHRHPETDRVYSSFFQLGADSGRVSSRNPNVQNLPRGANFRSIVIPDSGFVFVVADYSQIELRIAAEIANEPRMIEAYRRGEDLHKLTASLVNHCGLDAVTKAQRQAAKAVNFGLLYGQGSRGLKNYAKTSYGVDMTVDEASTFRDRFFEAYAGLKRWHNQIDRTMRSGSSPFAATLAGRRRWLTTEQRKLTTGANTPVQGTGADVLKVALGELVEAIAPYGDDARIVNSVHDEIVLECREAIADEIAKILTTTMVKAGERFIKKLPIEAESGIGADWASAKS
jgi:DNA polymerase I-like protein with 3'-5' exonuclease and polymerase domains